MCLITNQKEPFVADRDIVCFKRLYSDGKSIHHNFKYVLGEIYETEIKPATINAHLTYDDIDDHILYLSNLYPEDRLKKMEEFGYMSFGEGFHSATTKERIGGGFGYIFECIIPAGSEYYVNPSGLMVSNKIIVKGRV